MEQRRDSAPPPLVRNSHIVPRFYLNKFADGSRFVFQYKPDRKVERRSTKSVSTELDFFEYEVNGEATANRYENWFQRFETDAAAIYSKLHAGEGLTGQQEIVWASFLATVFLRSRKVRERFGPALTKMLEKEAYDSDDNIREMQYELLKQGVLVTAEDMRAKVRKTLNEMRAPAFGQLAGIESSAKMLTRNILEKERWFVLKAAAGHEFVTSDCPVQTWTLIGPNARFSMGTGFGHPNTAIVLPMSPTKFFFAGNKVAWESQILGEADTVVFNTATVQFAHQAVYGLSKSAEMSALVDAEMNKYTFGENCFIPAGR